MSGTLEEPELLTEYRRQQQQEAITQPDDRLSGVANAAAVTGGAATVTVQSTAPLSGHAISQEASDCVDAATTSNLAPSSSDTMPSAPAPGPTEAEDENEDEEGAASECSSSEEDEGGEEEEEEGEGEGTGTTPAGNVKVPDLSGLSKAVS
jgi:hypothetical protein